MTTAEELLVRLRDPSDVAPAARLARILVQDVLGRPLHALADPARATAALREGILAVTASDASARRIAADLERLRARVGAHSGSLGSSVPGPLREALREIVQLPLVARRDAVLRVLDRPTLRQIVRAQLVETLVDFGRKAASPVTDTAIGRGLGGLGKLAGQLARPSPLGAIASAVSGGVERQVEKRAADFADTAVTGVVASVADQMSDPTRAAQQAALRLDLTEGLLSLTGADMAELARGSVERQVSIVRGALAAWAHDPTFATVVEGALRDVVTWEGDRPLGDTLGDIGIRDLVAAYAEAFVRAALGRLVAGDAFAAWLRDAMT
jgi:hypothetical protein